MNPERPSKSSDASLSTQTQIVCYSHINGAGRLFGGQLMGWMDITGAVAARRHAGTEVVTASVDTMNFLSPAMPNDMLTIQARLIHVGRTSMYVLVKADTEALCGERSPVCTSTFVYVALDAQGAPAVVPLLLDGAQGGP